MLLMGAALVVVLIAVIWLGWSNGANDNFKGVATLYGSGTCTYPTALTWATAATFLGSLVSIAFAHGLLRAFSGKGLVPDSVIGPTLLGSVAGGAAITVFLATLLGMPTSTTHALTGALVGAGMMAAPSGVDGSLLLTKFAQPLLLSPLLAIGATSLLYPLLHKTRQRFGIAQNTCLCIGTAEVPTLRLRPVAIPAPALNALHQATRLETRVGRRGACVARYRGRVVGLEAQGVVDCLHYLSGAAVCFARAVNDTPKVAALLLAAGGAGLPLSGSGGLALVTVAMAAGGVIQSRKVAETMSKRITGLNTGQGLTANLVTAVLVLGASRIGLPVSTTHVSCGSIFGIGAVTGQARWRTIALILTTWVTTLPLGVALGAGLYVVMR